MRASYFISTVICGAIGGLIGLYLASTVDIGLIAKCLLVAIAITSGAKIGLFVAAVASPAERNS